MLTIRPDAPERLSEAITLITLVRDASAPELRKQHLDRLERLLEMHGMKDQNAVALGRKGGKVRSDRKRAAIQENLRLAREKRWPLLSDGTRDIGVAGLVKLLSKQHERTEANHAAELNPHAPFTIYGANDCPLGGPEHVYDALERKCWTCPYSWPREARLRQFWRTIWGN